MSKRRITKRPQARHDLAESADYISHDSLDAARCFLHAAESAFQTLARKPEMGTRCDFRSPEASGVRMWSIHGFQNYIIFYRPLEDGIDVVRVIYVPGTSRGFS